MCVRPSESLLCFSSNAPSLPPSHLLLPSLRFISFFVSAVFSLPASSLDNFSLLSLCLFVSPPSCLTRVSIIFHFIFFFPPLVTFHWWLLFCQTVFLLSVLPVTVSSPPVSPSASLPPPSSLISPTCSDDTARAPPPLHLIISNLLCHDSCW